jgi:hypothetical protein
LIANFLTGQLEFMGEISRHENGAFSDSEIGYLAYLCFEFIEQACIMPRPIRFVDALSNIPDHMIIPFVSIE